MVVPECASTEVRRLRIPRVLLSGGLAAASVLVTASVVFGALGLRARVRASEGEDLRSENARMRAALTRLEGEVAQADQAVARLAALEEKIRSMTMISDPARSVAVGPVGGEGPLGEPVRPLRETVFGSETDGGAARIGARAEGVVARAEAAAASAGALSVLLEGESSRLASTPSLRPTRGYVSSVFGTRLDPFTGLNQHHAGLDFSAPVGSEVRATADGVVRLAGEDGAYGLVVELDHGHGLTTRYAHLSAVGVRAGQKVERGGPIGAVGTSGRSTGPHLHYEVRLFGVPRDPWAFILD